MKILLLFFVIVIIEHVSTLYSQIQPYASVDKKLWACRKGINPEALLVYSTKESGKHSSSIVLWIEDADICSTLSISCPFEAGASTQWPPYDFGLNVKYKWVAVGGKYKDGVIFYSDSDGMKLNPLVTGSNPARYTEIDWFFNAGECIKY